MNEDGEGTRGRGDEGCGGVVRVLDVLAFEQLCRYVRGLLGDVERPKTDDQRHTVRMLSKLSP